MKHHEDKSGLRNMLKQAVLNTGGIATDRESQLRETMREDSKIQQREVEHQEVILKRPEVVLVLASNVAPLPDTVAADLLVVFRSIEAGKQARQD